MPSGAWIGANVTPLSWFDIAYLQEDSVRWIVWLGRYALDKETRAPNALLIPVRNRK
jgi:hypothetical protein